MQSDGPYKETPDDEYIKSIKAQSYADGRKAAEKDFKELLEFVNGMMDFFGRYTYCPC